MDTITISGHAYCPGDKTARKYTRSQLDLFTVTQDAAGPATEGSPTSVQQGSNMQEPELGCQRKAVHLPSVDTSSEGLEAQIRCSRMAWP
jgi:hypothetical protein